MGLPKSVDRSLKSAEQPKNSGLSQIQSAAEPQILGRSPNMQTPFKSSSIEGVDMY